MKKVYVAGPMSKGWFGDHMRAAVDVSDDLLANGFAPFLPQLSFFWNLMGEGWSYERWMEYDRVWLLSCDIMLRLPGESKGADRETAWAHEAGLPVYYTLNSLFESER